MTVKRSKMEVMFLTVFLLGSILLFSVVAENLKPANNILNTSMKMVDDGMKTYATYEDPGPFWLDRTYALKNTFPPTFDDDNDDNEVERDNGLTPQG